MDDNERQMEVTLLNKGIALELKAIKSGRLKTKSFKQIKKRYGLDK